MNKQNPIIYTLWSQRKKIAEVTTTAFVIGKGIVDFVRKDGIGKVLALGELAIGVGATAIHTGIADKIIANASNRKATASPTIATPEEYDTGNDSDGEPYDPEDDEDYDPDWDAGWDTINTGIEPEYDDDDEETDPEEETEEE